MLVVRSFALEQRHGRSEVVQLIAVAADSRQGRAHVGSMLTMLARPVPVEEAAVVIVVGTTLLVVCARAWAMSHAARPSRVVNCMVSGFESG